jgi:hypothetical protein
MKPRLRALPIRVLALAGVLLAACAAPAPPPARVVAPPEATTIVMPPPKDLSICQRDAKPTTGGDAAITASFESFSRDWIHKMRAVAAARAATAGHKRIRDPYEMELRPTGSAQAPYVGILSYCELALKCSGAAASSCEATASTVVKEMFRYQSGKWVY